MAKVNLEKGYRDEIILFRDMQPSKAVDIPYDELGEYAVTMDFYDGYAVEVSEEGAQVHPSGRIELYYPTISEVRNSSRLQSAIEDYTGRDDINQYDIALKCGVPTREKVLKDQQDIRSLLMPSMKDTGIAVFLKEPIPYIDSLQNKVLGVYVDRQNPDEDHIIHDRGIHVDADDPYSRVSQTYYEMVSPELRDAIFRQLADQRRKGLVIPITFTGDKQNVVTVYTKPDAMIDYSATEHHQVARAVNPLGADRPSVGYSFEDFTTALHFADEAMQERLHYGEVVAIPDMENCRVTLATDNDGLMEVAKIYGGDPTMADTSVYGDGPRQGQTLLMTVFFKNEDAQNFLRDVEKIDELAERSLVDCITNIRSKELDQAQRAYVSAYLHKHGPEKKAEQADRLYKKASAHREVQKCPEKWRASAVLELTGMVAGKSQHQEQSKGMKR